VVDNVVNVNSGGSNILIEDGIADAGPSDANNGHHRVEYNLGDDTDNHNGHDQHRRQRQAMGQNIALSDSIDIAQDEYSTSSIHPVHDAYNALSKLSHGTSTRDVVPSKEEEEDVVKEKGGEAERTGYQRGQPITTLEDIILESSSSLDSMEGSNDEGVYYIRASKYVIPKRNGESSQTANKGTTAVNGDDEDEEETSSTMWAKRNARSIDEGIRFKSQLREGLEEQSKLHRERMLSNLLEGVIGGTKNALQETFEKEKISRNGTNPFRWLGFGRGDNNKHKKNRGSDDEEDSVAIGKAVSTPDGESVERDDGISDAIGSSDAIIGVASKDKKKKQAKDRKFGARTIAGLIMALAEEVEDLEVHVDADESTPTRNKLIRSININFSRLGFKQLRMGGLDDAFTELESSMAPSEKFALASGFLKKVGGGRPTTADEAFDRIDVDGSGTLDEEELGRALQMAAIIGGNKFGARSKETLTELASRLVRLYDTNGDGVVDREEYQAMVQDMAMLRDARLREEMHEQTELDGSGSRERAKRGGWLPNVFGAKGGGASSLLGVDNSTATSVDGDGNTIMDVTENDEFWGSIDHGEGSIVLEDLRLDLRRLVYGAIPGVKSVLPGGPLILKPFTATGTASFTKDDIMDSWLFDVGLRRLVARALSRRVRGIRDLLDGAVFYGRTWKVSAQRAPQVEVAKLEDVHFDKRNRLIITGRAKITEALGYTHDPIEQGFKVRTKIGTRNNGRIIGLLEPEIAIFAECPKDLERNARRRCKEWFGYTIPTFKPLYFYIPLVSPLKKSDKMDGFNMGEDNQIKSIDIKNGKLRLVVSKIVCKITGT